MVIVLPPLTTSPALILFFKALNIDKGLIPGWNLNHLSSNVRMDFSNFSGTKPVPGNRHCPSEAILAPSRLPSDASTTVDSGILNSGNGESKTGVISTPAAIRNILSFLFKFLPCYFYRSPRISRIAIWSIHSLAP